MKRVLGKCEKKVKDRCYLTLVRPHLEYAASVWDPYEVGMIKEINRVQSRTARFVVGCYDTQSRVSTLINELGWDSLPERRVEYRLNLLSKFESDLFSDDVQNILREPSYYGRKDHERKIKEIDCRTERFKMSFFPRTIRDSNRCAIH